MPYENPAVEEVEAVLRDARTGKKQTPSDSDLFPVYNYVFPPKETSLTDEGSSSTSSSSLRHFYCSKCPNSLYREAATYLLFLFAFRRDGMPKRFLGELERTFDACTGCSRAFGGIRRRFGTRYLGHLPTETRKNFFAAVDKWQAELIISAVRARNTDTEPTPTVFSLSAPMVQLLFSEPSLLTDPSIYTSLDNAITTNYSSAQPNVTSYGLSPLLIRLLSSPKAKRRTWAISQLPACARRPLGFVEWCRNGIGEQIQALYLGSGEASQADRLEGMEALLRSKALSQDTIEKGLIDGIVDEARIDHDDRGLMSTLSHLLGSSVQHYPSVLGCFTVLLSACPTQRLWTFDTSSELPHTLFSEVKDNKSFQQLVTKHYESSSASDPATPISKDGLSYQAKGKGKEASTESPFSWMSDMLRSLVPAQTKDKNPRTAKELPLPQALAKVMNFCFAEMQHESWVIEAKAAAAQCGFEALADLRRRIPDKDLVLQAAFSSTLQVHAKFISRVALRREGRAGAAWDPARSAGQTLLEQCFAADGRDLAASMLGLAQIAFVERRRLKKARGGREAPPPQPVTNLHKASVQGELWRTAYSQVGTADVAGIAIFLKSIATFSHIEILDRHAAWTSDRLKAVIKDEDWVGAVRAINSGLKITREGFAHTLEALAMQPDTTLSRTLWDIPRVAESAVILLLSPIEEIHDPIISLVQQAFDDADDRLDCFRILLQKYPDQAMDGLTIFLAQFIQAAPKTPDACSLAKWLVRCFTDVLEVLCNPSSSEPLLHNEAFLANNAGDIKMSRRVGDLWQLMTESLAIIFDRTKDWAPLYENEVMVDWMRDALIFGRNMTEHTRVFEAAYLNQSGSRFGADAFESPMKIGQVGKKMVEKLEKVLKHLVSWLRLTDVETLHQTFELIRTIVGRIAKANPDLTKSTDLETTLQEIDKFARRAGTNYRSRLSDDLLSELADILDPFELSAADDEIQFVREQKTAESSSSRDREFKPLPPAVPVTTPAVKKNAFDELMRKAGAKSGSKNPTSSPSTSQQPKKPSTLTTNEKPKPKPIDLEEYENDDFMDGIDLQMLENKAKREVGMPKMARPPPVAPVRHQPTSAAHKLNINVVPRKVVQPSSSSRGFKSGIFKEARRDVMFSQAERNRAAIGGVVHKLPQASALGSGLGAYTGPPRKIKPMPDSGSSASESSDEENKGIKALVNRQKSPIKQIREHQPRSIKVLGSAMDDLMRSREERRAAQHRTKQRLRPDVTALHRYILSWDPQHTGPKPPHHPRFAAECSKLGPVPTTFIGAKQYEQVMLPLFLQELWAQSQQEKPSSDSPVVIEISTRAYEDDFLDIDVFSKQMYGTFVTDSDIVLLTPPGKSVKPVMAKVQAFKRKQNIATIKLRILAMMDQKELSAKAVWHMSKHFSLSTAIREFGALKGLAYYEPSLLTDILAGQAAKMPRLTSSAIDSAMEAYSVNEPQAKAILGAMETQGFALIQGPPGTGKTKTISGLVGKFLSERRTPISTDGQKAVKPKLLVCAPSNAAIDEVCKRLLSGVPSSTGKRLSPNIVRIGMEKAVNISVKEVSLDSLVEAAVSASSSNGVGTDYSRIQSQQAELKGKIADKQNQIQQVQDYDDKKRSLESELHTLLAQKVGLVKEASRARDAVKDASRHLDGARRAARDSILQDADIICATLSGSGHESLAPYIFETVIIDEAAQAIEMSCLIPLKYGCTRCIMVGDPNQLPPTQISQELEKFQFNESLFVRMAKRDKTNMHLLSIQYRMHPFISELPSKVFYDGHLKDGEGMAGKTAATWHQRNVYGPYRFFHVEGMEQKRGTSTYNPAEAGAAVDLYQGLERDFGAKVNLSLRIGVISMYKEQVGELRRHFTRVYGEDILQKIEFNTVDGFQGQEKDIIILSTVRSGAAPTIGFLRDARRMNVALTRAKSSLFVIGNAQTLERGDARWKTIVGDARDRGFLINYNQNTFAPAPMDTALPPPKPKIKKEKVVKRMSIDFTEDADLVKVSSAPKSVAAAPIIKHDQSISAPTRVPVSAAKASSDRPPKATPAKRPSDAPHPGAPEPKRTAINGSAPALPKPAPPPVTASASGLPGARSSGPGPSRPVGTGLALPRPAPPAGRPPAVPPPPVRSGEDALFIKKKKKNKGSAVPPPLPPTAGPSVKDRYK